MGYDDFNMEEILSIAERIERNGADFYREAAAGASSDVARRTLEELAGMEDQHEQTFSGMKAELTEKERQSDIFDMDNEAAEYMKALADRRVFHKREVDMTSMKAILTEALAIEKDSIAFYRGMRNLVPSKRGKDKVDNVIKEEMSHVVTITEKLGELDE